jgi:hypothetical protein
MIVAAARRDVQRRSGRPRERLERVRDELRGQRADPLAFERHVQHRVRTPREVEDHPRECLVHRHRGVTEALDPGAVAQRLEHRLAQGERDVLHRVVLVDLQVAGRGQLQVEQAVMREGCEQVVVEADPGRHPGLTGPIEVERQLDAGLPGRAADRRRPHRAPRMTSIRRAFSGALRTVSRRWPRSGLAEPNVRGTMPARSSQVAAASAAS